MHLNIYVKMFLPFKSMFHISYSPSHLFVVIRSDKIRMAKVAQAQQHVLSVHVCPINTELYSQSCRARPSHVSHCSVSCLHPTDSTYILLAPVAVGLRCSTEL